MGLILGIERLISFQRAVMCSDVPAPTHAPSPSVDTGRAQPAEGNGIDARICSYAHGKHTPKLLGALSRTHAAKGQDCVHAHQRTHARTHTHCSWAVQWVPTVCLSSCCQYSYFLTKKTFPPPFPRGNKLFKCEMKPCLIKKGIRQAGAIPLVEQRSGRGDES